MKTVKVDPEQWRLVATFLEGQKGLTSDEQKGFDLAVSVLRAISIYTPAINLSDEGNLL